MIPRSYLYVPADRADRLAKAPERGADAIICDLEDGVAPDAKETARHNVASFLADGPECEVWVRINAGERSAGDVRAVHSVALRGVLLPKADVDAVVGLAALLDGLESDTPITALIETAAGVLSAPQLARAPRVVRMGLGEADLCAELDVQPSADERELAPIRMQIVVACAAAGIDPPTAPISTDFRDLDAFRASTEALKRMGFGSRSAIHPAQVDVINEVFTPTAEEVVRARRLVELFEASERGSCVDDEGRMVDEAVVRSARRTLQRAETQLGR